MADTIKVRAVEGLLCPHAPPKAGYVGWERVTDAEAAEADYVVPGGNAYRLLDDDQDVPDTSYYRRALKRGDIERVEETTSRLPLGVADESER